MPFVTIDTNSGPADFHYDISTPTNHSAAAIEPELPTILFIHAAYTSDEIFEPQFADPGLRQFNLVTVQMRGYAETQGRIGDAPYTPRESADDIWNVMEALALPRLHVFAISIGTSVALELASRHPQRFITLTLCSPLSSVEDDMIRGGRLEVFDLWVAAHKFEEQGGEEVCVDVDESVLRDTVFGAAQLLFNNQRSKMIDSMTELAVEYAKRHWSRSRENIQEAYKSVVGWHLDRKPIPDEQLAKINCPVSIVHFKEDVAYPSEPAAELATKLTSATVTPVYDIRGSHLGNVTNPKEINAILRQTVLDAESKINKRILPDVFGDTQTLHTPFTDILAPYVPQSEDDDSDDSDLAGFGE